MADIYPGWTINDSAHDLKQPKAHLYSKPDSRLISIDHDRVLRINALVDSKKEAHVTSVSLLKRKEPGSDTYKHTYLDSFELRRIVWAINEIDPGFFDPSEER